jgi:cell shape-determining protein MreC
MNISRSNQMRTFQLFAFLFFFFIILFSAYTQQITDKKESAVNPSAPESSIPEQLKNLTPEQLKNLKEQINRNDVEKTINEITQKILKSKDNSKLFSTEIQIYSKIFYEYSTNPNIEKETKIYREWYKNISDCLLLMTRIKFKYSLAEMSKDDKEIDKYKKEFTILKKKLETIIDNPIKIPPGSRK